jgi:hypothetical protein
MSDSNWWSVLEAISAVGAALAAAGGVRFAYVTVKQGYEAADRDRQRALEQQAKELVQSRQALEHAKDELRWRQTVAAQESIRRMVNDHAARHAMLMLDWNGRSFKVQADGPRVRITWADMRHALRTTETKFTSPEVFVRDSFDALFHHFQIIMHQIENRMYAAEDVRYPIGYYSARLSLPDNWQYVEPFLTKYDYDLALKLIKRIHDEQKRIDVSAFQFSETASDIINWEQAVVEASKP